MVTGVKLNRDTPKFEKTLPMTFVLTLDVIKISSLSDDKRIRFFSPIVFLFLSIVSRVNRGKAEKVRKLNECCLFYAPAIYA